MEVIPLDDRIRSTVLNSTTTASDAPDFHATVYHDDDASALPLDEDTFDDAAATNGGLWTRRNKLLLTLAAGSALLCAVATGGGIAAHRARVSANRCFDGGIAAGMEMSSSSGGAGKSSKSPSTKSSKAPSAKSSKAPTATVVPVPAPVRRLSGEMVQVDADELYDEEEEDLLRKAGLTAAYPIIPKTVEDRRKNRMLAQQLGQPNVGVSWVRRLQTANPAAKSSKAPSTKSSKAPSTKSSKAPTSAIEGLLPDNCKCQPALTGAAASSSGAKSSKSPSTKSSKSPSTKSSKAPTDSTKSPSTKSSKSPSTKSSKAPTAPLGVAGMRPAASPITCQVPVSITRPQPPAPVNGGGSNNGSKSSKAPSSNPGPITPVRPVPPPTPPATDPPRVPEPAIPPPPATTVPPREPVPVKPEPEAVPAEPVVPPPTPPATPVDPPCEEGDDCDGVPPPVEEVVPPVPTPPVEEIVPPIPTPPVEEIVPPVPTPPVEEIVPPVPTPPVEEIVPPVPTPPVEEIVPPVPTPPINCENNADWSSTDEDTCVDIAAAADPTSLCATAQDSTGLSASVACPAVCNEECIIEEVNCDDDKAWSSTTGADCVAVASDPDTLCSAENAAGVSATEACPAVCNEECIITLNCDNDAEWISTTTGNDCEVVKDDPKARCREVNDVGVSALVACPASCNVECFPEPPLIPLIPIPVPSPSTTTKPSVAVTTTVGTPENKNTYVPTRGFLFLKTPLPTELATAVGSEGGTITVSTETTGPPTVEVRDGERR